MKILVTGFDPFGGEAINPALESVKLLPDSVSGAEVKWIEIPTVFHKSADVLEKAINEFRPDSVLCVGQAGGRFGLTPERVAINQDDARIPDNEKNQPIDQPIREDGQPAYFSTLPIKAITKAIQEAGLPASVSNTAGTFVCNHLMYQVLYLVDKKFPFVKHAGFMHIPFMTEQVVDKPNMPSMNLEDMGKGVKIAVETIAEYFGKSDIQSIGGETH
ncbi:pyroglutamyl-peptidase I [Streptococcus pluranimalium]|uniref:pyroglutamyl-peptidase I n=1 Tax=Streptococcus pluranimalium TaxID=82348 RepID=UPI003F68F6D6